MLPFVALALAPPAAARLLACRLAAGRACRPGGTKRVRFPRHLRTLATIGVLAALAAPTAWARKAPAEPSPDEAWAAFVALLLGEESFPADHVCPLDPSFTGPITGFLAQLREGLPAETWKATPEVSRVGGNYVYVVEPPGVERPFVFTLAPRPGSFCFVHLENIQLRLDRLPKPPVTEFPPLDRATEVWMVQEGLATEQVRTYILLRGSQGPKSAAAFFRDGAGYALSARTWVPTAEPERAFVLYLCWEETNLRGSEVTLLALDDHQAVVQMRPTWLLLYERTAHLRSMIPEEEYRALFQDRWTDRAAAAGWDLDLSCEGADCRFQLTRP